MLRSAGTLLIFCWLAALGHAAIDREQSPPSSSPAQVAVAAMSSMWDGVFTDAQAARGATVYRDGCARCHGDALQGHLDDGAPLAGREFMASRDGSALLSLFNKIKLRMPDDDPGSLSGAETADVVAYILQVNKVPAGKSELSSESEPLRQIRFDATKPKGH